LVIQWITTGGTFTLHDDYTAFSVKRSIDLIDVTAGNEADKSYIKGIKDGDAELEYFLQSSGGTLIEQNLVEGTNGTLIYSPRGTGVGMPKRGFAAFIKEYSEDFSFDEAATGKVPFQKTGPVLYAPGTTW
jgi:hypothetical protein